MKRFQFRLQSVLRLREVQLEAEKAKLQYLLSEERKLMDALNASTAERLKAKTLVYGSAQIDSAELRCISTFLLGLEARAGLLRARINEIAQPIKNQTQCVIEAERSVRLLIKLRDARLHEWTQETAREAEIVAQEAWLATHARSEHAPSMTHAVRTQVLRGPQA